MIKKLLTTATFTAIVGATAFLSSPAFAATTPTPTQQFNQAAISWNTQPNTKCYRIYYKESTSANWQFSVRCKDLPPTSFSYTIKSLKPHTAYTYDVRAVSNINKSETSLGIKQMVTTPMNQ